MKETETPDSENSEPQIELSVVMPCLNEAATLATCIQKAQGCMEGLGVNGEVIIADNGSTDGSQQMAEQLGARVVNVSEKGYGSALRGGIAGARGKFIIMADSDDSYDFTGLKPFIEQLREGYDLVMGNRFRGGIKPGAMPPLHKYLGNPVLSFLGRLFFRVPIGDFHCGLRGFTKEAITRMMPQTTGMEFASEIVVKAALLDMKIAEVPTTLSPDGRDRPPHLRSWRDGWRHLRFLLMYSPRWLFLYPGILLICLGILLGLLVLPGPLMIGPVTLDVHTLVYAAATIIVGFNLVLFAVLSSLYAITAGLLPRTEGMDRIFRYVTLEVGLVIGAAVLGLGLCGAVGSVVVWSNRSFGPLDATQTLRLVIPSALAIVLGTQGIFASFFLSMLGMKRGKPN